MKKALTISIAQTLFTIEEDAFVVLDQYLTSVRIRFGTEVVGDIESRIAEQLLESKEKVITLESVEKILSVMGRVEDFDDTATTSSQSDNTTTGNSPLLAGLKGRKFYRSTDDAMLAGVCSGLALYLGIEVLWVRLIFILLSLFNGFGLLLYIILWLIVPEAKTASQKLEMSGTPVTLETLSERATESVSSLQRRHRGRLGRIVTLPFRLIGAIIRRLGPILRMALGVVLGVISVGALIGIMIMSGFLISDATWIANDASISTLLPGSQHVLILCGITLAVMIPALFVLLLSVSVFRRKNVIPTTLGLGLLGVWLIALVVSGFGISKVVNNYQNFVNANPAYKESQTSIEIREPFHAITVQDGLSVEIVAGTTTKILAEGTPKAVSSVHTRVENGTLVLERERSAPEHFCLFCSTTRTTVILYVESIDTVSLQNGSQLHGSNVPTSEQLTLTVENGSYMNLTVDVEHLDAQIKNGSRLVLNGSAQAANISATSGSIYDGSEFAIQKAVIKTSVGSRGDIYALTTLDSTAISGSHITYSGTAKVTKQVDKSSSITSESVQELDSPGSTSNETSSPQE